MTAHAPRHARQLESISVVVSENLTPLYEQVLRSVCQTVAFFEANKEGTLWRVEGVKEAGQDNEQLQASLSLAEALTGEKVTLHRKQIAAQGWLRRNHQEFKPFHIGQHFLICPSHLKGTIKSHKIQLILDAGMAFGSGEHATTRSCLLALEYLAPRKPYRILDMGCGSGILAMAAARLLHRPILAADIDPWAVKACYENLCLNHLTHQIRVIRSNGWRHPLIAKKAPYDLIFANILARPLRLMANDLSMNLTPGGYGILSGLLAKQIPMVLSAYRQAGLHLVRTIKDGEWATLIVQAPTHKY